jgi:hypothetical protein
MIQQISQSAFALLIAVGAAAPALAQTGDGIVRV